MAADAIQKLRFIYCGAPFFASYVEKTIIK